MCLVLYFVPFINWLICFALYLYLLLTELYALLYIYTFDLNFALYFYLWTESCNLLFMYTFELQILYFALFVYLWTKSCTLLYIYIWTKETESYACFALYLYHRTKSSDLLYIYTFEQTWTYDNLSYLATCRIWQHVGFGNMSDLAICRI